MRCHYEVMGLPRDASFEDIKKQYRKLALQWHPDRNHGQEELATQTFKEISTAYTVLNDPQERKWYDDHRESILRGKDGTRGNGGEEGDDENEDDIATQLNLWHYFNPSCFQQFNDSPTGFYTVYREIFEKIAEKEVESIPFSSTTSTQRAKHAAQYPSFGSAASTANEVLQFYASWDNFISSLTFAYVDKYNVLEAPNRQVRRAMEKENAKLRDSARKDYISLVKSLIAYVKKRDERYQLIMTEKQKLKEEELKLKEEKKKIEKEKRKELREQWKLEQEQEEETRKEERKGAFLLADNDSEEEESEIQEDDQEGQKSKGGSSKKKSKKSRKRNDHIRMVNDHRTYDDDETEEDKLYQQIQKLNLKSEVGANLGPEPSTVSNSATETVAEAQKVEDIKVEILQGDGDAVVEDEGGEDYEEEEEIELFPCEICNKQFKSEPQLAQHLTSKVHRKKLQEIQKANKKKEK